MKKHNYQNLWKIAKNIHRREFILTALNAYIRKRNLKINKLSFHF